MTIEGPSMAQFRLSSLKELLYHCATPPTYWRCAYMSNSASRHVAKGRLRLESLPLVKRREDDAINGLTPKSIATAHKR